MRKFTLALAAAVCLAVAAPPVLASNTMSSTRPSDVRSAPSKQSLAQNQYNSTKKKDENNTQDQTKRKSWGGGG